MVSVLYSFWFKTLNTTNFYAINFISSNAVYNHIFSGPSGEKGERGKRGPKGKIFSYNTKPKDDNETKYIWRTYVNKFFHK